MGDRARSRCGASRVACGGARLERERERGRRRGGGGGGGGGVGGGATSTSAAALASVSVSPTKVAFLSVATGTVRLNKVAASPVAVSVSNDVFNSPNLVTMPTEVIVPAGSSSATFLVQAGDGMPGTTFAINVSADESPAADATVPRT